MVRSPHPLSVSGSLPPVSDCSALLRAVSHYFARSKSMAL